MSDHKRAQEQIAATDARKALEARLNTLASALMAIDNIPDNASLLWVLQVDGAKSNRAALKRLFAELIKNEELPGHQMPMLDLIELVRLEIRERFDRLAFRLGLH